MFHLLCSKGSASIKNVKPIITITTEAPRPFFKSVENKKDEIKKPTTINKKNHKLQPENCIRQ